MGFLKILLEIRDGMALVKSLPSDCEIVILDRNSRDGLVEKQSFIGTENGIKHNGFLEVRQFTEEEIEESKNSRNLFIKK